MNWDLHPEHALKTRTNMENDDDDRRQILVIHPPPVFKRYAHEFAANFEILKPYESTLPLQDFLRTRAQRAQVLYCWGQTLVTDELMSHLPSLKLVATNGTGFNHVDLAACRRRGISVANTSDVFSEDTADYAVGLVVDVVRRISGGDGFVRKGIWGAGDGNREFALGSKLGGKRVGIVGMGNIGSKIARRLEAFGCKISYNSRNKRQSLHYDYYPDIVELAAHSDVLLVSCLLSNETRHLIDRDVLGALGKKGVVVNIARGPIIDEEALVRCLVEGEIGGAGLDVFEREPEVPKELLEMENVVLSPHRGGYTEEAFYSAFMSAMGNLEAFFSGKPLITPVSLD